MTSKQSQLQLNTLIITKTTFIITIITSGIIRPASSLSLYSTSA